MAKGISFQNILCYCLTLFIKSSVTSLPISKHPMLLFNLFAGFKKKKPKKFQNILCYCLTAACARRAAGRAISKHPMLLFNTNDCVVERHEFWFQNILCYCLTASYSNGKPQLTKFQNILCYCLTGTTRPVAYLLTISKHPMLLFNKDM